MKSDRLRTSVGIVCAGVLFAGAVYGADPQPAQATQPADVDQTQAVAVDKVGTDPKPQPASDQPEPVKILLTGSHLPQNAQRTGRITTGHSPVTILDRREIERSGARTVTGVLSRDPAIYFRGHR